LLKKPAFAGFFISCRERVLFEHSVSDPAESGIVCSV